MEGVVPVHSVGKSHSECSEPFSLFIVLTEERKCERLAAISPSLWTQTLQIIEQYERQTLHL